MWDRIKVVVFDLAGTVVDHGSCAPAVTLIELFARQGVTITVEQARAPMGMAKRDHIQTLASLPDVAAEWRASHAGQSCGAADVDALYEAFLPLQLEWLPRYAELIPGACELSAALRARKIEVAVTTGYARPMLELLLEAMAAQGFVPDHASCASDVRAGRPAPWMIFRAMDALGGGRYPPAAIVNVGDTIVDVASGINAGVWSVGVAGTGNMLGLSLAEAQAAPIADIEPRLAAARQTMLEAGAHFVVDGIADCLDVVDEIEERLGRGEMPE